MSSLGAALALPFAVAAKTEPSRPVKFIIASSPGTGGDTMSRMMSPDLQKKWGQPVIVENKPGASGVMGINELAKSAPDGLSLMIQTSTMFLLPYFYQPLPFDVIKSFQPLTQVAWSTFALVVNSDAPVKNFKEFVAWVKSQPGKLNYASPGIGTENHLFMELLKLEAGLDIVHVPYSKTAGAVMDVLSGQQVKMMFLPIQPAVAAAKDGKLRIIGLTMKDRFPLMPDLPTLYEQGLTGFDYTNWYGIWAPAGLPADMTQAYSSVLRDVLTSSEIRTKFGGNGWVVKTGTPKELETMSRDQLALWGEVVKKTKVQPA